MIPEITQYSYEPDKEYRNAINKAAEIVRARFLDQHEVHFMNKYFEYNPAINLVTGCTLKEVRDDGVIFTDPEHQLVESDHDGWDKIYSTFMYYASDAAADLGYDDEVTALSLLEYMKFDKEIDDWYFED